MTASASRIRDIYAGVIQGAMWTSVSFLGSKFLLFLSTMVLARLLAPAQFGQISFALLMISYLETIGNFGIGSALIYEPRGMVRAATVAFMISLAMGGFWVLLMGLASPYIATFFHDPGAEPVLRAMAVVFLIKALGSTHEALLRRRLAFKRRMIPDGAEAMVKGGVSILLALFGAGVWSLVWGQLLGAAAFTIALWIVIPWRPAWRRMIALTRRLQQTLTLARRMMRYGAQIVMVNILSAILHHADLVVVGHVLGGTALGLYTIASRIPEMVVIMMIRVMGNVTFPAYARLQDDLPALQRALLATLRYVSLVTIPLGIAMAALAEPLVLTLYGKTWHPSIPVLQALAIAAALRSLGSHTGEIYKAIGRPHVLTYVGVVRAIVLIPALLAGARYGIAGVACAQMAVTGASTALNLYIAGRLLSIPRSAILAEIRPALLSGGLMLASLAGLLAVLPALAWGTSVVMAVGIGTVVYVLSVRRLNPAIIKQMQHMRAMVTNV